MVGFIGALLGGAAKGWSAGQMEAIKAKREEQLANLDRQFRADEGNLNRAVQKEQIAASERQANASLGVQEKLGNLQAETQKSIAQLGANTDIKRTEMTIEANKKLQEQQAESAQLLNTELKQVKNADGSYSYELFRKDGGMIERPTDKDGNKLDWAATDTDTDEMKNMKSLMLLGVDQDTAMKTIFEAKNANRELAEAGIFKAITDGMSTMKNLGEEDFDFAKKKAKDVVNGIYGPAEAPAAGSAGGSSTGSTTAPAAPAATTDTELDFSSITRPPDMDDAAIIAAVKADPKLSSKSPAMVRRLLIEGYKVKPDAVRAAGL